MRAKTIWAFIFISVATVAFATAQIPDRLIYGGQTYDLNSNPLDRFFAENPDRHPDELRDDDSFILSSALWRGYVATFEIQNDVLTLAELDVLSPEKKPDDRWANDFISVIDKVFPDLAERRLDWYSGILVLPTGEMTEYVHLSYASLYESYLLLRIEKGRLVDTAEMTEEEFFAYKKMQFQIFRESKEFQESFRRSREFDWSLLDDESEKIMETTAQDEEFFSQFVFDIGKFTEEIMLDFDSVTSAGDANQ